jgi:hypothetical protein
MVLVVCILLAVLFQCKMLSRAGEECRDFEEAAASGNTTWLDRLPVECVNTVALEFTVTMLTVAIDADQVESVQWLLDHGADPNDWPEGHRGCGSIRWVTARSPNSDAIMKLLVESGGDINQACTIEDDNEDLFDLTPLLEVVYYGDVDTVMLLKKYGAKDDGEAWEMAGLFHGPTAQAGAMYHGPGPRTLRKLREVLQRPTG